tara:strand:- start:2808 stop:3116 length:309 start_codon:yes stop_codon:yes gene_type:complete
MAKKLKSTSPELDTQDPQLTKEEMTQKREEITAFYKDNIPHLEIQADYEVLLATIEEARAKRMQAQMFMAQQYAAQNSQGKEPSADEKAFKEAMESAASKMK